MPIRNPTCPPKHQRRRESETNSNDQNSPPKADPPPEENKAQTSQSTNEDTEAPVITILGNNPANLIIGSTYADVGATVEDNVNHNLGITVNADEVTTAVAGTYRVYFSATDQAGNSASTRTVIVGGTTEPTPVVERSSLQGTALSQINTENVTEPTPAALATRTRTRSLRTRTSIINKT